MAGGMDYGEGGVAYLDRVSVPQKNIGGVPDPILAEEEGEAVLVGVGQHGGIALVDVDLESRLGLAEGVNRHDVVEMSVSQKDPDGGTAVLAELAQNGGGGRGGVDDERLAAILQEVAVGAVGAGEQIDDIHGQTPPFGVANQTLSILLL